MPDIRVSFFSLEVGFQKFFAAARINFRFIVSQRTAAVTRALSLTTPAFAGILEPLFLGSSA
jgi:hypothetical protein